VSDTKACSKCKQLKPATREFFGPLPKAKDGLHSWCKACLAEARRIDRAKNKQRYQELEKRRYERHGEARRAANRKHYAMRPPKIVPEEKIKIYNANRRKKLARCEKSRQKKLAQYHRWMAENREKANQARRGKWALKTPKEKFRYFFGAAVSRSLKRRWTSKKGSSWELLLGYSLQELRDHLETKFTNGMSWDNYGKWHVDHIVPQNSFIFSSPSDDKFRACWALTNLQPLWGTDNCSKRARLDWTPQATSVETSTGRIC